jgi:hypothetical protein
MWYFTLYNYTGQKMTPASQCSHFKSKLGLLLTPRKEKSELKHKTSEFNYPPVINFIKPLEGYTFLSGYTIPVQIPAIYMDGSITSVGLFVDSTLQGTQSSVYSWNSE